jgi:MiaB-like tRNA modifying enzyme
MKVAFEAYGCTLSYGESRRSRVLAEEAGHEVTDDASDAPVVVMHTCIVIGRTERKMLRRVDELTASGRHVVMGGCMPRAHLERAEELAEEGLTVVSGERPEDVVGALGRIDEATLENPLLLPEIEPHRGSLPDVTRRTDAIIPIASGCLGRCTYCITRFAWGPLSSMPIEEVVKEARWWLDQGFREVQLTAQDTGVWGRDLEGDARLPDLVRAVASIDDAPAEYRVRVGMLNPDSLSPILEDFVEVLRLPRVYRFVHLPVQSGSDRVLGLMLRRYTAQEFEDIVGSVREAVPDVTVHTDIICGFPTETDEDFQETLDLLGRVRPDVTNIKAFSPRPGTDAAVMGGDVEGQVVKARTRKVTTLATKLNQRALEAHVGETVELLVTELGKEATDTLMGRDPRYNPVVVKGGPDGPRVGDHLSARLAQARGVYLLGELE